MERNRITRFTVDFVQGEVMYESQHKCHDCPSDEYLACLFNCVIREQFGNVPLSDLEYHRIFFDARADFIADMYDELARNFGFTSTGDYAIDDLNKLS